MDVIKAVGIDPASGDYECALIQQGMKKVIHKVFSVKKNSLKEFITWIKKERIEIIAIEGHGGFCMPLEKVLRKADLPFYSFNPYLIAKYRQAILGQNKNNRKDAAAVALYAMTQYSQNNLEKYKRKWFPDDIFRPLTRMYEQKKKETTREINRLWKIIHRASGDLFLALHEYPGKESVLTQIWLLKMLSIYPDIFSWQFLTEKELITASETRHPSIRKLITDLKILSADINTIPEMLIMELQISATTALTLKQGVIRIHQQLEIEVKQNPFTTRLMVYRGIGPITASQIFAEIADINRFPNNHHLASYAGFGRREYKTGTNNRERPSFLYNHRLKNAFYTAAKNYTLFNPDSHLTGYYRMLRDKGMKNTEAYKRIGRALIRRFFRDLMSVKIIEEEKTRCEGNLKNYQDGQINPEQPHTPTLINNTQPIEISVKDISTFTMEVITSETIP